jgi:hypothetical protein
MKIITRAVLQWDGERYVTIEEDSFEYEGPLAECRKPKAPAPPDPKVVAQAQTEQNRDAALYNAALNRVNTYGPMGSQEFSQTGIDPKTGAPIYRQDIKLDPKTEALFRQQQGYSSQLGDIASGMAGRLPTSPFSFSGLPARSDLGAIRDKAQGAIYSRNTAFLDPQFKQGEDALRSRLANQGIVEGSEAYTNAIGDFNRGKEFSYGQARDAAIAGGGAESDRAFGQDERLRQNMMAEQLTERNQPYQEFGMINGMISPADLPQFQGMAQVGTQPADIAGAIGQQYQGQLDAYNAKMNTRNAMLGGLFGLGGSAILAR